MYYISLKKIMFSVLILLNITAHAKNAVSFKENLLLESINIVKSNRVAQEPGNVKLTKEKEWTIILYMSADNNLAYFAGRNLLQLANIGSNNNINIVAHLDTKTVQKKKITLRYFIKRNKLIITNHKDQKTHRMDSGNPETLISCCKWAMENFPAKHYMLVLWNHGIGCIDSIAIRTVKAFELFNFNPYKKIYELDRSIPFLEYMEIQNNDEELGICFDDTTRNYLTNENLAYALKTICTEQRNGKKIDIVAFDACLMSMIEIANIIKPYADFMVSSQEVELGTGYNYTTILSPFHQNILQPDQLAKHAVQAYKKTYQRITNDFTQSAINLQYTTAIEQNINMVASLLVQGMKAQKSGTVKKAIRTSRHKLLCTHFDEPSYVDLHHFYSNLINNLSRFKLSNTSQEKTYKEKLKKILIQGIALIEKAVIANAKGKNLSKAGGISIYFPERRIHRSYIKTTFAKNQAWIAFLKMYIQK